MPGLSGLFGGSGSDLLKTGQTTQYNSELDDGYYEKGVAKAYTVLTAGQYSGTSNIDLIHLTAATIAFVNATSKITDSGNGLAMFKTGKTIVVSGAGEAGNNGVFTIATGNVAGEIVVNEALTDEVAGATVSIAKREAHSNNCVLDQNTGLMWSRYTSAEYATMGTGGDGKMVWTGQLYDIFQYCAAANTASLGGYTDWRVPNATEQLSLINYEDFTIDGTAFPSGIQKVWVSTTDAGEATRAMTVESAQHAVYFTYTKTTEARLCALVRGGV